jgi:hypothetical protein
MAPTTERILDVLREAMTNYSLDGIFFNIPGYPTTDYDGNYVESANVKTVSAGFTNGPAG